MKRHLLTALENVWTGLKNIRTGVWRLLKWVPLLLCLKLLWFFIMYPPQRGTKELKQELLARRAHLIHAHAQPDFGPKDISSLLKTPFKEEIAIVSLSMTTLAITNIAYRYPETRNESLEFVGIMIERMLSSEIRYYEEWWWGKDPLDTLAEDGGSVGYLGHLNLMLACYRLLGGDDRYDILFKKVSSSLAKRAKAHPSFHVETFPRTIYTSDNTIAIATLHLHDQIFGHHFSDVITGWTEYTRANLLDSRHHMVRYHVSESGEAEGTSRGVAQAWNSMWLPFFAPDFAKEQYIRMKGKLLQPIYLFGAMGVREYPRGEYGPTDIIAGPIIAGISGSATGFALGGAAWWNDEETLQGLLKTCELFGSSLSWRGHTSYLLGPDVGEAIVLAARTMTPLDNRYLQVLQTNDLPALPQDFQAKSEAQPFE